MRVPWLTLIGPGLLFSSMVEGAPGKHQKRKPYGPNDPGTSSSQASVAPIGYNYGYTPSTDLAPQSTGSVWNPNVPSYPSCPDWVLCSTCPGGYYCPNTKTTASPTQSLVIVPTCSSWKTCPECRGGYKCWKPRPTSTEAPVGTTSATLTIIPTCYPWNNCNNCVGGYSCPGGPVLTTVTITAPKPIIYPTCSDYVLCSTCNEGYICPFVTKGSGVSRHTEYLPSCTDFVPCQTCEFGFSCPTPSPTFSVTKGSGVSRHTEYLPTCSDFKPCPTCPWGWSCPSSDPADKTYTITITQGTDYTTVTETIPAGYYDGYGTYGTPQPSETASTYDWASYDQPTCTDYIVCPTCALGYICPSEPVPPTPTYYQPPSQDSTSASKASSSPSFYPPPPCDNYVVCRDCFLGYYCPEPSQGTPATSKYPVKSYGPPSCDDYVVCPACPLGYYCPSGPSPVTSSSPTTPLSYGTPPCSDYIVCPSCPLGYYCPTTEPSSGITPTSTYNWASYEQPTCPDYIVCPSCPLGYYCPSQPEASSRSVYNTKSSSNGGSSKPQTPYLPSTTYYIGLPTTTLIVAPTCPEYVLCPVCPGGYYCPSNSPTPSTTKTISYYTDPGASEIPTAALPPCDIYVFCPECELGYSCLISSTSSTTKVPKTYQTGGTANPPMSNPYPVYTSQPGTPTIDGTYATAPENPGYGPASVPAPELPTCAGYVLCPTCPLGYYCVSTVAPTAVPSIYYGVAPTGAVESVYSTTVVSPPYISPPSCPGATQTVTVTTTRDVFRIYNICATDPYAILTSLIIPTVTVTQCDPSTPSPYIPSPLPSSSDCETCDSDGSFYPITRPTNFGPLSFTNWGQGRSYSQDTAGPVTPTKPYDPNSSQTSTSCSFKPCDGGYYCETCPHKWYCPTPTDGTPYNTAYPPYL
ncbi:hypothetical protein TWF281_005754 [Arthrobotrys megalospora]